jgi:RNA polymerase sigma factor (sigma-70 family)
MSQPISEWGAFVGASPSIQTYIESRVGLVYAVCSRVLRQPTDIDDAVQETFIKFTRSADRIRTNLDAWLHACARTTALDIAKRLRSGSHRCRPMYDVSAGIEREDDLEASPQVIDQCIEELAATDRHVVISYFYRNLTQEQIARELGVSKVAVNKRLTRAKASLRAKLVRRGVSVGAVLAVFFGEASAQTPAVDDAMHALRARLCDRWRRCRSVRRRSPVKAVSSSHGVLVGAVGFTLAVAAVIAWHQPSPAVGVPAAVATPTTVVTPAVAPAWERMGGNLSRDVHAGADTPRRRQRLPTHDHGNVAAVQPWS